MEPKDFLSKKRKYNVDMNLDELLKEGKATVVKIPDNPDEAKKVFAEVMKHYPKK